jgi:iron-sulfur cluster repair protein YtfE (RIC family)
MDTGQQRGTTAPGPSAVVDTRDMVLVHQAMRREVRLAPAAVRRTACDDRRRVRRVARHLQQLTLGVTLHHQGEDRLLWPKLLARVPEQLAPLIDLMEAQHETVHALIGAVDAQRTAWAAHPEPATRGQLAETLTELSRALDEHLAAEERDVLPLAAAHLTAAEWQELGRDGVAAIPASQVALAFGTMMYEGDPAVIAVILSEAPAPARLLLPRLGVRAYARHARRIHGTATP